MSENNLENTLTRPSDTIEDYLMNMHVMERDLGEIVAARLAELMDVSPATVAMTLKRMERDDWITGKGRKKIHLTDIGRTAAYSVIRRHMLTEWLLVSIFKIPIFETHDEAHGIQHGISPNLEEKMREILNDPKVCPHGNPLPGYEHVTEDWIPLTDLSPGDSVILRRIHEFIEDNPEVIEFLQEYQLFPGKKIEIMENLSFNQTIKIAIDGQEVTLGYPPAQYMFAERPNS